jgi:hypothetical protein
VYVNTYKYIVIKYYILFLSEREITFYLLQLNIIYIKLSSTKLRSNLYYQNSYNL